MTKYTAEPEELDIWTNGNSREFNELLAFWSHLAAPCQIVRPNGEVLIEILPEIVTQ